MFIGEYEHSVDAKGRVIMPAKLREDIGEKFIVTKGLDGCLFAYSKIEWSNFEDKLKTLPLTNKNARDFVRFFLSGAVECDIDKQGRFLIPNNLREYATLEKEIKSIPIERLLIISIKSVIILHLAFHSGVYDFNSCLNNFFIYFKIIIFI